MDLQGAKWFLISWAFWAVPLPAATVVISPSATPIAQGGSTQFTITVQPDTYVQQISVAYQGEAGQDVGSSSPFQTTHTFNTAADGLVVTATVTYTNGDPAGQASTAVDVVGLTIIGQSNPSRGAQCSYLVQSNPTGKSLSQISWTYTWAGASNTYPSSALWSGKMVAGGTLTVAATVSGVTAETVQTITVAARTWTTPISCAQDNDPGYGDLPTPLAELGANRDRDSDVGSYVFGPRSGAADFTPARSLSQVSSGPCAGCWYVLSSTLNCQRETVINKYIKADGPLLDGTSFLGANADCFSTSASEFVQAVRNHEYRGTPETFKSLGGHQGRIEASILDDGYDAKQGIEQLVAQNATSLSEAVNGLILYYESQVADHALEEDYLQFYGPNWGGEDGLGTSAHSCWDDVASMWTNCTNYPISF